MAEAHMKTRAFKYGKDYKIDTFIGNLQAYRLAAGEVNAGEFSAAREKHGHDDGAVFGDIISGAVASRASSTRGLCHTSGDRQQSAQAASEGSADPLRGKRKRRHRRRKRKAEETSYSVPSAKVKRDRPDYSRSLVANSYASSSDSDSTREEYAVPSNLLPAVPKSAAPTKGEQENQPRPSAVAAESDSVDFFNLQSSSSDGSGHEQVDGDEDDVSSAPASAAPVLEGTICLAEDQLSANQQRLTLPEEARATWSYDKHKWSKPGSSLDTYKCWKCNRVGHLPQDCVSTCNVPSAHPALPGVFTVEKVVGQQVYSKLLREYYGKCRQLQKRINLSCAECGARSNLANCLDCGLTFCDGRGHLASHLLQYSSHRKLYSAKLRRQVKCCKPTCEVVDIDELYCCSACWSKVFDRHYSMINATWSAKGLSAIVNGLCCDEHFHWHRINCDTSTSEQPFSAQALHQHAHSAGLISEFLF